MPLLEPSISRDKLILILNDVLTYDTLHERGSSNFVDHFEFVVEKARFLQFLQFVSTMAIVEDTTEASELVDRGRGLMQVLQREPTLSLDPTSNMRTTLKEYANHTRT